MPKTVHIGCSGWSYKDWRGKLYPEGLPTTRWLRRYAEEFPTVEVNSTFYRLASERAVGSWIEQTPAGFLFSLKMSRYVTHVKRLNDAGKGVKRFVEPVEALRSAGRMGPVLWQLPETFHRDDDRLGGALASLPPGRSCFEFRHPSWFCEDVYELLRQAGAALVIGDHPERPFQSHELTTDWTTIRLHHGARGRRGNYSTGELEERARLIERLRGEVEVFAYFNNDREGFAVENARWLRQRLRV